jgi:hypothetical protein
VGDNPMALSAYLRGGQVSAARTLPLHPRQERQELLAQEAAPGSPAG